MVPIVRGWCVGVGILLAAAPAFGQADLVVRVEGVVQGNGTTVNVGSADIAEQIQTVVVLRNEGNQTLQFSPLLPIELTTDEPDAFSVIQPALETGNTLSPNGSTALAVRFTPNRIGAFEAQIAIATSDADSPFLLRFEGSGEGGVLRVLVNGAVLSDGGLAEFPLTVQNQSGMLTARVENVGNSALVFTSDPAIILESETQGIFTITQPTLNEENALAPGAGANFTVRFGPVAIAPYAATLSIETESADGEFVATLAGSGIGRLGTGALCSIYPTIESQVAVFLADFFVESEDFDDDDIPEDLALALLQFGACLNDDSPIWGATLSAFDRNAALLAAEPQAEELLPYRLGLAALIAISSNTYAVAAAILEGGGIVLELPYWSVQCDSRGTCSPIEPGAGVTRLNKSLTEPYSGAADWDGDGFANRTELANVLSVGGNDGDFVRAATDPRRNGTETALFGCASGESRAVDDGASATVVLLLITAGALAVSRRRRPLPVRVLPGRRH